MDQGIVSITEDAANEILSMLRERNPQNEMTAEQIMAVKDMRELFGLMGGPGFMPGGPGPEGRPDRPEGFPGGPDGMGGPGGFPGGGFENENAGPASADFYMNDTVNAFSGVTDETE